jgi:hypothetical protein
MFSKREGKTGCQKIGYANRERHPDRSPPRPASPTPSVECRLRPTQKGTVEGWQHRFAGPCSPQFSLQPGLTTTQSSSLQGTFIDAPGMIGGRRALLLGGAARLQVPRAAATKRAESVHLPPFLRGLRLPARIRAWVCARQSWWAGNPR